MHHSGHTGFDAVAGEQEIDFERDFAAKKRAGLAKLDRCISGRIAL